MSPLGTPQKPCLNSWQGSAQLSPPSPSPPPSEFCTDEDNTVSRSSRYNVVHACHHYCKLFICFGLKIILLSVWGPPLTTEEFKMGEALLKANVSKETREAIKAGIQSEAYHRGEEFIKERLQ